MKHPRYSEIANSWALWSEYFDPMGTMAHEDWETMPIEDRLSCLEKSFGPEEPPDHDLDYEVTLGDAVAYGCWNPSRAEGGLCHAPEESYLLEIGQAIDAIPSHDWGEALKVAWRDGTAGVGGLNLSYIA